LAEDLTHIGPDGRARMVDVGDKAVTQRAALARGTVHMAPATRALALSRDTKKGDPIAIAELAGIMAAKQTSTLIPLCHPLPLSSVKVAISEGASETSLVVEAEAKRCGMFYVNQRWLGGTLTNWVTIHQRIE